MKVKKEEKSKLTRKDRSQELELRLARALADYDNLRKRVEREKDLVLELASSVILTKLFPVFDMLETAQKHVNDQGLVIALGEFKKVFEEEGLEEINPKTGDKFDQNIHEVVETVGGGEKEAIAEVLLKGWKYRDNIPNLGGKVLLYAKVKVYK